MDTKETATSSSPSSAATADESTSTTPRLSHEGEHHGDYGGVEIKCTQWTFLYAACAALNSCNLGYDIGVSTDAGQLIQQDFGLTQLQRELFVGSINFWAIFGALGAQSVSDSMGRRRTFLVAAVGFIVGILIQSTAKTYTALMIGRIFVGLGVGTGLAIDPLYIAEMTPAKHRGELVTWAEIALNVGIVLGFAMAIFVSGLPDDKEWRVMFGLGAIMPFFMIILVCTVMPETPRWLVTKHQHDQAKAVLERIYPAGYDVDPVVNDIKEAIEREEAAEKAVGWGAICRPTPALRRMLLVGVGTAIAQQAVGIDAIQYYLLDVLDQSGVNDSRKENLILVFLGLVKLFFIIVGGKLFDRMGRRPLFFVSLTGMAGALLMVSIAFYAAGNGLSTGFVVFGLALYLAFFSVAMGPGAWLIPAEVFAISIRAKAMSVATTMNRITATLMSATFLSTATSMGWGSFFLMLSVISLIVLAFLYCYLPETKGRSLEDMSIYFAELTGDNFILEAEAKITGRRQESSTELTPTGGSPSASSPNKARTSEII